MSCNINKITLVLLLCCVICEICCNTLYEKGLADVEVQLSEIKEQFDGRVDVMKEQIGEMKKNIQSLNEAVTKLVFTLLEGSPEVPEKSHEVEKREVVISSNPLTNLPLGDLAGLRGSPGKDGVSGEDGRPGKDGVPGKDGKDGRDGIQGLSGRDGLPGPVGPAGPPGTRGKDGLSAEAGGAVYTRWGRTTCGNNSQLLYSGYAGGSNYGEPGGGVNYQCMPLDPQYNRVYTGSDNWYGSYMAGVEYQTFSSGIFPNSAHNQNAPCARCYTNNRSALMMIPAKRDCSEGWNKEYEGYLMTERDIHVHTTTFECVDASPEYINGEGADTNGALFQFIRTQCNRGGHCPPYDGNKQITCVVCSK